MYDVSNSTDGDWWFAKNSRIRAKTSMPTISAPTPMLLIEREQAHAGDVDDRRRQSSTARPMNDCMSSDADRRRIGELDLVGPDRRHHERHRRRDRGHGDDAGPEVDPAGEPAERPVREPLRPLVDRTRDREVAGQLGEVQGDEGLAEDDERPRPEDRRPADAEGDGLVRERARRDRDVAERQGEVRRRTRGTAAAPA